MRMAAGFSPASSRTASYANRISTAFVRICLDFPSDFPDSPLAPLRNGDGRKETHRGDDQGLSCPRENLAGGVRLQDEARQVDRRQAPDRPFLRPHARRSSRAIPAFMLRATLAGALAHRGRTGRRPQRACQGAGRALDRGAALHEHERRSRARLPCRRPHRGHHHRARAPALAVRHRPQFELHLQGQGCGCARRSRSELGVRYVLEGSVRTAGGRIRVTCAAHRRRDPASTSGPSDTTASCATFSRYRTTSPSASSPRSSRTSTPRKGSAPPPSRPEASTPGASSRAPWA